MQRNLYQTIEEYLQDPSFRRWALQGIDDDGWEQWMKQGSGTTNLAREAQLILLAMGWQESQIPEAETENALQATWQKIGSSGSGIRSIAPKRFTWLYAAAAMLLLGIGLGWHFMKQPSMPETAVEVLSKNNLTVRLNQTKTPMLIMLEDGSSVILQPGSQLEFPEVFDRNERKVSLTGEGFFEISKNPSRPFLVYANEVVTRVVGTSFRIKAYSNQPAVEVIVRTGQVKVFAKQPATSGIPQEIALHPNESIRFVRHDATFEKPVIAAPHVTGPIEQLQFDFEDTPVSKILETIELAYGLKINYPKEILKDCYLSTALSDLPLQQKLKIICESTGGETRYEIRAEQITIFSNGCN
ncbi:FecR family protein [Dyadobacter sp. CY323]|uniref:FecR family protein n=1 Tax=Dyadobacter sp. CY323 TaxID=2907302 RepID=UPI001F159818|nr:FecR family protein [Dyadobacter sp. CY323]MCE6991163.1 FecR domain-containing protein [Dyadobacter sp. CY323]